MNSFEPDFNPDAHHDRVIQRGRALRNRRRVVAGSMVVLAVALVTAGVAAAAGGGGSGGHRVVTLGRSGSTTTDGGVSTTTDFVPASLVPLTTTNVAPTATTAAPPGSTTTRPSVVTSIPVISTTVPALTTTTLPAVPACTPSQMSFATVTDHSHYALGGGVNISLVVQNISSQTCSGPSYAGGGSEASITGPVDVAVPPFAVTCTVTCLPPDLAPGGTASYDTQGWPDAMPAGSYQVVASRGGLTGSPALFTVG